MGCSNGREFNEKNNIQNKNQDKKQTNQNKDKNKNKDNNNNKGQNIQRRGKKINSLRSSIRERKNSDLQSNEKILTKDMILSERENQSVNQRNQLSLIQEEFSRNNKRKKSRSRSLRSDIKKKRRKSKKYKTERYNEYNEDNENQENEESNEMKNEGKTVTIQDKPIYVDDNNNKFRVRKGKQSSLESNEASNGTGNNKIHSLHNTLNGNVRYSKKNSVEIKLKKNNTFTSSENNSNIKKSNLRQNSNKMLITINDTHENEYSNFKYDTRKKRKTKRSSSNITAHGSNFLHKKTPQLILHSSNKDSNSLSEENNSKQSGKLYSLDKQSGKLYPLEDKKTSKFGRQSTKKILINDYINIEKENEPLKRELTKIIEKEKLSHLIQIDENFNKINKDLISNFNDLVNNNKEIQNKFDICVIKKYCIEKNNYDEPIYIEEIGVNIINKDRSNNWEKEPLLRIKDKINNIMSNKQYKNYSEINFENYYKEYEIIEENIKFHLLKGFLNSNIIEGSYIDFTNTNIKLILFFDINDSFSLHALQLISSYHIENENLFDFFPIYGNHIDQKKEMSNILQTIKNQISLNEQEIYFISKQNSELIENSFLYHSNEKINKIISKIYLIDENNRIRAISNLKDFQTGMINNLNETIEKSVFINKINRLINLFEEQKSIKKPFEAKLNFKKVLIFQYDNTKNDFEKEKIFEGISGYIKNNSQLEKQIKQNIDKNYSNLIDKLNISKINNSEIHFTNNSIININQKEKDYNIKIYKEINMFLNQVNAEEIDNYFNIYSYYYNINSINNLKYPEENLKIQIEKHFKMEILLSKNLFEQKFQFSISNAMSSLFPYPEIGTIDILSCIPNLKDECPKEFNLIIPEKNFEKELVQIILPHQPNLIIMISYTTDFFAVMEIESRFKKLKKYIDDDNFNVNVIFIGEQIDYESMIDDLNFINEYNLKIYISDNSNLNFPFYFKKYGNNNENAFNCILTNKKGQISYFGNFNNIKIKQLFNDIKAIDDDININEYYYEEIDRDEINNIVNKLENIIKNEFLSIKKKEPLKYRPFIQISYDKKYHHKTNSEKIENIRIKILIKERHKKIFTTNKEIKNLFKLLRNKYNALILVVPLDCEEIIIPQNCEKCGKKILEKESFYYDQTVNIIYCQNCESNIQNGLTHLIFFKSNDYNKEIINDFYFSNISKKEALDKNIPNNCSICEQILGKEFYLSLTQFNVKNCYSPLCLCNICFNDLNRWSCFNNENENYNQKLYCLHSDDIVMRKIVLKN